MGVQRRLQRRLFSYTSIAPLSYLACLPAITNVDPSLPKCVSSLQTLPSLFFFFPNLELEGKLRQQEQVCVGPYPPIFGSLRALAQVQRRELLAQLSFQMSSDHLLLAQGSRTLSAFTRSRTWVGYIHRLQQLLPDTQTRCAHQRPTMEGIMLKLILPVLTFMLLPEVGDFQGGKEIDQSLESWVLVPVLKLSSCVNSIITLLQ